MQGWMQQRRCCSLTCLILKNRSGGLWKEIKNYSSVPEVLVSRPVDKSKVRGVVGVDAEKETLISNLAARRLLDSEE